MAYKVFLSHNTNDAAWVRWIAQNATSYGIEVYLYEHDLKPGEPLAAKVQQAINSSDAVVVLLSANSQFSPYVQQEIGLARGVGKQIIPLVQPGVEQRSLAMLQGVEYIPFDLGNPQPGLAALIRHLQGAKLAKERGRALLALAAIIVAGALITGGG